MSYGPTGGVVDATTLSTNPYVFPKLRGQKFLAQKSPIAPTTLVFQSETKREVRFSVSDVPTWRFKARYEYIQDNAPSNSDLQKLFGFFLSCGGKFRTFYFHDVYDDVATMSRFGTGDGTKTTFQLTRQVAAGTIYAFDEPVFVILGTPTVYINGTPTTAFTITDYGAIQFNTPPVTGASLSWTGNFMFLCRFDVDQIDAEQLMKGIWSPDGVEFVSWLPI